MCLYVYVILCSTWNIMKWGELTELARSCLV